MADRPIIFSAPMVRALLDGRKTQTRRVLPNQPPEPATLQGWDISGNRRFAHFWHDLGDGCIEVHGSRLFAWRGDRLWVQEDWRTVSSLDLYKPAQMREMAHEAGYRQAWAPITYLADGQRKNWESGDDAGRRRWSRHMIRELSRLTLTVTDVRVQRLQEISEAGAKAEGAAFHDGRGIGHSGWRHDLSDVHADARSSFARLWNSLHGPDAWDANPWVAAISFDVHRCNIDQMPGRDG
ncbi:hypothetical protein [Roseicyclus marinus]|uniref:hypothetical protein n=1 Tax=Roseicyclus marinus TaxID=2161673 RepID=UPI00241021D0|nr:hypothetical protein [Roseicyclus marinus]MDG3040467.1 hypothetical protein [Roseicyclus marinus]